MKLRSELQKVANAPSVEISSDEEEVLGRDDLDLESVAP